MQINNLLQSNSIAPDLGDSPQAPKSNPRQCGQDSVQISSLASQLTADPSKLSQLQAAYDAGTYNISPSQIANSILNALLS
jgi:anti-sigma28 factor (negative regulator of flagellin synthesis)